MAFSLDGKVDDRRTLGDILYEETQGITNFVNTVFFEAQLHAIRDEDEEGSTQTVTADTLRVAAQTVLRPVKKVIHALRHNNLALLATMQDVHPLDLQAEIRAQFIAQQMRGRRAATGKQGSRSPRANGPASAASAPQQETEHGSVAQHDPYDAPDHLPEVLPGGDHRDHTVDRRQRSKRNQANAPVAPETTESSATPHANKALKSTKLTEATKPRTKPRKSVKGSTNTPEAVCPREATADPAGYDDPVQRGLVRSADEFLTRDKTR